MTSGGSRTIDFMAKVIVQHVCSECGTTTGRWLGKCPGCGAFGSLVEELSGRETPVAAPRRRRAHARPAGRRPLGGGGPDRHGGAGARPRPRRWARACLARARRGRAGRRQVDAPPRGARQHLPCRAAGAARDGRGVGGPGQAPGRSARRCRAGRDPGGDRARLRLRDPRAGAPRRVRDRLGADALFGRARLGARLGGPGARGRRAAAQGLEGAGGGHDPRRARDEGRLGRGPAGARAPRRLRAPVRRRSLPRPPDPAGGEESLRVDERARRLRDDRRRVSSASPIPPSCSGAPTAARSVPPSPAPSRERDRSCSRSSRSSPAPTSRCPAEWRRASTRNDSR